MPLFLFASTSRLFVSAARYVAIAAAGNSANTGIFCVVRGNSRASWRSLQPWFPRRAE
jgi:hypothetical protein